LVKTQLHKTLTELIRERIVKQTKWERLHTVKPVKQIATDLGFEDIFYFSRLFKGNGLFTDLLFAIMNRRFEAAVLSMHYHPASIPFWRARPQYGSQKEMDREQNSESIQSNGSYGPGGRWPLPVSD
jgi:hypothetical protein